MFRYIHTSLWVYCKWAYFRARYVFICSLSLSLSIPLSLALLHLTHSRHSHSGSAVRPTDRHSRRIIKPKIHALPLHRSTTNFFVTCDDTHSTLVCVSLKMPKECRRKYIVLQCFIRTAYRPHNCRKDVRSKRKDYKNRKYICCHITTIRSISRSSNEAMKWRVTSSLISHGNEIFHTLNHWKTKTIIKNGFLSITHSNYVPATNTMTISHATDGICVYWNFKEPWIVVDQLRRKKPIGHRWWVPSTRKQRTRKKWNRQNEWYSTMRWGVNCKVGGGKR